MKKSTLSDQIAEQLHQMILQGTLEPGEKLPAERVLAERMHVSRPSLREAIKKLASKGLLESRHGGGNYIRSTFDTACSDSLVDLLQNQPEARYDVLEARHALDGQAAYYAALRATRDDKDKIRNAYEKMIELHHQDNDPWEEAKADAAFHLSITEASHNIVMLYTMRNLFNVLQSSIQHNLDKLYTISKVFEPLSHQHESLMNAVLKGSPDEARQAAQQHMVFVEESLQAIDQEQARNERFLRQASLLKALD